MILVLFYVWEDARVWALWNSVDLHLNPLGPVACFSVSVAAVPQWLTTWPRAPFFACWNGRPLFFVWNTNYLELGVGGSVPQHHPHFRHQSQAQVASTSDQLAVNWGLPHARPPPHPSSLDISLNDSRNSGKCFTYCYRFIVNDSVL